MNTDEEAVHTEGGKLCCAPAAALGSAGHTKTHFSRMLGEREKVTGTVFQNTRTQKILLLLLSPPVFVEKKGKRSGGGPFLVL